MSALQFTAAAAGPMLTARSSRRVSTRREIAIPCQAVREHDFRLVADRTLDVSVEGLLLPMRERVLTGESLIVSFEIPGMWIDAEATVARIVHGRRPGDDGLAMGVLFHTMGASARAALAGFLHGRPPPLPRRGPLARMRRGLEAPQLADQVLMETTLTRAPTVYASELDVEDVDDREVDEKDETGPFDPLGILREVADAWRRLTLPE
jgi:hypothetical protein